MDFEIKGHKYRAHKLSTFEQLKVSRKLLPVVAGMLSEFTSLKEKFDAKDTEGALQLLLPKVADAVSSLSDEDTNAILFPCLRVVSRKHMDGYAPVMTGDDLRFDDIGLMEMLSMVARVVADSLGNFLQELPTPGTPNQ